MTGGAAPKRKGSQFERDVAGFLRAHGFPYAERAYGAGRNDDRGDLDGLPGFVVECKAHRELNLARFVDEAIVEAANAGPGIVPVVVAKRRHRATADAYVVMRLADWAALASEASGPQSSPTALLSAPLRIATEAT